MLSNLSHIAGNFLISLDQAINCLVCIPCDGFGTPDETLSARLFRCHLQGVISDVPHRIVDALFFFDPQHCYESWRSEIERRQLPGYYRIAICQLEEFHND